MSLFQKICETQDSTLIASRLKFGVQDIQEWDYSRPYPLPLIPGGRWRD